jgi:ketosteroid isomerase-like protein
VDLVEDIMRLWAEPVGATAEAVPRFAAVYADPVVVNGVPLTLVQLTDRARMLQGAFGAMRMELLERVDTPGRTVIVFRMCGRHVGPYESTIGVIEPTGNEIAVRTIDVLTIEDGRIAGIWVVPDELGLLSQLGVAGRIGPA